MSEVLIRVPSKVGTLQVEGFPEDCKRSKKGAIHIRPGTMQVTEDELAHIQTILGPAIQVLDSGKSKPVPPPPVQPMAIASDEPDPLAKPAPDPVHSEPVSSKKSQKKQPKKKPDPTW